MPRQEITTLREDSARIWGEMIALSEAAAKRDGILTAEERSTYEKLEKDFDAKRDAADRMEKEEGISAGLSRSQALAHDARAEQAERDAATPGQFNASASRLFSQIVARDASDKAVEELRSLADKTDRSSIIGAIRSGDKSAKRLFTATSDYRDAFVTMVRGQELDGEQRAALNIGTGAQGGYLVPVEFYAQLVQSERFYGVMNQLARTIITAGDGPLTVPKVDPANRATAAWIAENAAFAESEDQFLTTTLGANKQGFVAKASDELLLDSAFDILGFVAQSAAQAIGILSNTAYVAGAAASTTTPKGILNLATVGYTMPTGNTSTITYNALVELYHSVLPAYRPRGQFVFSDTALKLIRELTDSQNRPLWQPSLTAGDPDTLFGRPVFADPDVPVPATSAICGMFGDINSAYWIRMVQDVTVKVLNELYAGTGQVGYRIHRRIDGTMVDTLAVKTLKNSAS